VILSHIRVVTATLSTLLVPIFGLLLGAMILGEQMTIGVLIGSGLIIFGIVIAQFKKKLDQDHGMGE
jgi:drug/metabolite transporter (DMT)-like permease